MTSHTRFHLLYKAHIIPFPTVAYQQFKTIYINKKRLLAGNLKAANK